jgi:hypothetical protein
MVNFGLNSASILGIFLAVAGAGLYFLRSIRPELSRDHDIFFAAVGLLCGLILLFQGWRLDPILQFGQFLLTGSAIFFAVETVRLRGATTEQARRNTPIVDPDRKVSRTNVYTEAVLDQLEPYEDEDSYNNYRSLRGEPDPRASRSSGYESEAPRSSRGRRSTTSRSASGSNRYEDSYDSRETPRQRRPRSSSPPANSQYDDWNEGEEQERPTTSRPRRTRPSSGYSDAPSEAPRKRRPRPSDIADMGGTPYEDDSIPTDYVDYQPIDESEADESSWEESRQTPERNPERESRNNSDEPRDNPVRFDY